MIDWSDYAILAGIVLIAIALWLSLGWVSVLAFAGSVLVIAGLAKAFYGGA